MNYCFVRRELLPQDPDQTARKEVRRPSPQSSSANTPGLRTRRSQSEPKGGSVPPYPGEDAAVTRREDTYDFYLAVPDPDLEVFGLPFAQMVESRMNMRPCLTVRDVPLGPRYETMAEFLETRCGGKVVFVVSNSFADSDECQFLVHFAKHLDPDAKQRKLIPLVIDKGARIPLVLEGLCSINYNAAVREKWLGKRLWEAIHAGETPSSMRFRTLSYPGT